MLKRYIACISSAIVSVGALFAFSVSAEATTVDDVAEVARQYGYSEEIIMQGYNKYYENPELYTSDDFDLAIAEIRKSGTKLITTVPQNKDAYTVTTTAPTTTVVTTAPVVTDNAGGVVTQQVTTEAATSGSSGSGEITLTLSDGSTFTRMSREDFIKLSYDDKMAYVSTFTPSQQQAIIDDLSPEEYKSLLKQAPQDKKLNVIDDLSKAADAMGMNITINEISDDNVSVALRNENGELIGVANAGNTVEDTGYDRRGIFVKAGLLFLISGAAVYALVKKCFAEDEIGEENGR